MELAEPIRYNAGDPIEAWLNELLCLDAANHIPNIEGRLVPVLAVGLNDGRKLCCCWFLLHTVLGVTLSL